MNQALILLLICLGLLTSPTAGAFYRTVEQWTAADGLPVETLAGLTVDRDGQLWIATHDGAVRYQGFDFQYFNRGSSPALPGNRLSAIIAAPEGGVLVQFEDGHFGHLDNQTFQPVGRADPGQIVIFDEQTWFISYETQTLWSWQAISGSSQRNPVLISVIATDPFNQRLLLGAIDGRILSMSPEDPAPQVLMESRANAIAGLAAGPDGQLLVLDAHQAREYPASLASAEQSKTLDFEQPQIHLLRASWTARGWLVANLLTDAGAGPHIIRDSRLKRLPVPQAVSAGADRSPYQIERIDSRGGRWINDGQQLFRDDQLMFSSQERILDFIVDPFDQIWLAQPTRGLRLLKKSMIETFGNGQDELADPNIYLVAAHDQQILVGGWAELASLDPTTGQWSQLLDQAVRDVLPDADHLLVGAHGLCRLAQAGQCVPVADFPAPGAEVLMLHRDALDAIWAGTDAGLFRRTPAGDWDRKVTHQSKARTALESASGQVIFGTNGDGLLVLPDIGHSDFPFRRIGPEQGLASLFVRSLLAAPGHGTLVGTEDAGLCLLSESLEVVGCLSTAGGLPHHSVHYMIVDDLDRLWVNSNGGIYWVDLRSLLSLLAGETSAIPDFYRFGRRHGMPSVEGNGGVYRAGVRTADGRIWFPNQLGLVSVSPNEDASGLLQPLTTRIQLLGPTNGGTVHLNRHARHLELNLSAIALAEPENVQFRYRFDRDSDWTEIGDRRHLHFRDLNPGRHRLEVSARHVNTPWAGTSDSIEFSAGYRPHEHPALRATFALVILLSFVAAWLATVIRQRRLEAEIEDRTVRLDQATHKVAGLAASLERIDIKHRTALHATSQELRSALNAAMEPLLRNRVRSRKAGKPDDTQARAQTLSALIDQIGSFGDPASKGSTPFDPEAKDPQTPAPKPEAGPRPSGNDVDLAALIRMEVLLHLADTEFSVEQMARRLGMSRSVLYRRITETFDSSPAELIRDIRLEQATKLLLETSDQVSTIAYATGFRSVSAFSKAFSKKMGVSPRQWRRSGGS